MEITGPQAPPGPNNIKPSSTQAIVDSWKPGQLLNATVSKPRQAGQTIIEIAGKPMLAQTPVPLQPGQKLKLEVTHLPTLALLKVLAPGKTTNEVTISLPSQQQLIPQWRKGQTINAVINTLAANGRASISLGGQQLEATVSQPVPVRQGLKLEIVNSGSLAALRILNLPSTSESLGQSIRQTLPQQGPLQPLLIQLDGIARQTAKNSAQSLALPSTVVDLARQIMAKIPDLKMVSSANGLQQAIKQSGLFLETSLQQAPAMQSTTAANAGPAAFNADLKGSLIKLLVSLLTLRQSGSQPAASQPAESGQKNLPPWPELLRHAQNPQHAEYRATNQHSQQANEQQTRLQQLLGDLIRSVESGLARIKLNQLVSAPAEDDRRSWSMDIPVRHGDNLDVLQLRIEEEKNNDSADKKAGTWHLKLAFDLQPLGPVDVCVSLMAGVVNTVFWAQHKQTLQLINAHMDRLRGAMQKAGVMTGSISAYQGSAPETINKIPAMPQVLLDIKV